MKSKTDSSIKLNDLPEAVSSRWSAGVTTSLVPGKLLCRIECLLPELTGICNWLTSKQGYRFACMVIEEVPGDWIGQYIFYGGGEKGLIYLTIRQTGSNISFPSISKVVHAADWHEREAEDLFGLVFEGHPRLNDFVLHEEWPEGVNPMKREFNAKEPYPHREAQPEWRPTAILHEPGAFMMPIGPVYAGSAESAHFLLETVGEDVVRTIPRLFYKYRGVEKIAEGQPVEKALLLAERFSGSSAFAHSLAFCQAVEEAMGAKVPQRAREARVLLAELERLRHHVSAIEGICNSTGLAVAASQTGILEEELLRISCEFTGHRYLFGLNIPGGLSRDFENEECLKLALKINEILKRLQELHGMLRYSSSFLDRLEEVGMVSTEDAFNYGLVGPVARASGVRDDLRRVLPYAAYESVQFSVPGEREGDGYARLRLLFGEAEQSANIISQVTRSLSVGDVFKQMDKFSAGSALGWAEAPLGAAFHWLRIDDKGMVMRYALTTPSFTNWHGFHLAAEDFAFQDFPIILATFGLSIAESDR